MGGRLGVAGLCLDQVRGRKGACDWAVMIGRGGVVGLGWVGMRACSVVRCLWGGGGVCVACSSVLCLCLCLIAVCGGFEAQHRGRG